MCFPSTALASPKMIQEIASEIGEVFRNLKRKDLKSLGKIKSFTLDSGIKLVFQ